MWFTRSSIGPLSTIRRGLLRSVHLRRGAVPSAFLLALLLGPLSALAADSAKHASKSPHASSDGQCVEMAPNQRYFKKGRSRSPKKRGRKPVDRSGELYKPMDGKELKLLLDALRPIQFKSGDGYRIAGLKKGSSLTHERMEVLMEDILAVLTKVHLEQSQKQMQAIPDFDKATMELNAKVINGLDICAQGRYAEFDSNVAIPQVTQLVLANQAILEELLIKVRFPDYEPEFGGGGR